MAEKDNLEEAYQKLKTARDDLKVRVNLGVKEVKDIWEGVEDDFQKLNSKMKALKAQGGESIDDVEAAAKMLVEEVENGLNKLRKRAKS